MQLFRKQFLTALFSSILAFFLMFSGCRSQDKEADDIPVNGAVCSVHRSDGSQHTYIGVVIGPGFTGALPDDIDSIAVSGPGGILSLDRGDFAYNPQWRAFWSVRPGNPKVGTYTFKVASGKKSGQATDTQSTVTQIPRLDTHHFHPARSETVTCVPPVFSWQRQISDSPLFYQVEIRDINRRHIYRTRYVRDMDSVRLPPDILNPGLTYQWRVRVADGGDWISLDNRSQSRWVAFTTAKSLDVCSYRYRPPEYTDGGWEVSSLEEQAVDPQKTSELMRQILNGNLKNIHSILLIKNGKLILEEYFWGYHRNVIHPLQSVTKSVTSILIGIAKDRGENIEPDVRLSVYLPEYEDLISESGKSEIPDVDVVAVITSQHDDNAGDFRGYSAIENYIIPAVLKTDPVVKTYPFNAENYRRVTGKYRWPKAKLNLKIFIDNEKLYGETVLFDGKFELLPVEKGRFRCVSKDIGEFWLDIIRDPQGEVEKVKMIIGFSNLTFERKRSLYFGF